MLRNLTKWVCLSGLLQAVLLAGFLGATATAAPKAGVKSKSKKIKVSEPLFPASGPSSGPASKPASKPSSDGQAAGDLAAKPSDSTDVQVTKKQSYARGLFGLVSGLGHVGSAVFVFGGDYVRNFRPNLDFTAGLLRWNNVYSDSTYSIDFAMTSIDGGAEYRLPIVDKIDLKGSGRLGLGIASAAVKDVEIGLPISASSTVTALAATLGGSIVYTTGRMQLGAELRKPIFFSALQDGATFVYLMATGTYSL